MATPEATTNDHSDYYEDFLVCSLQDDPIACMAKRYPAP